MLLLLRFQINLDPGKGEFNFEQQALKLEYVPPASCGEVERATITIMDKGEKQNTPTTAVQRKVVTNNMMSKPIRLSTFALLVPHGDTVAAALSVTMPVVYFTCYHPS